MIRDLRLKLYPFLSDTLPFITALLIIPLPSNAYFLKPVFEKFLIALFLFVSWQALRNLYFVMKSKHKAVFSDYVSILFLALVTPAMLQVLKNKIEPAHFYLVLIALYAAFLIPFYEKRSLPVFSLISKSIYIMSGALLSFAFCNLPLSKSVIIFSLSVTLIFSAQYLSLLAYRGLIIFGRVEEQLVKRLWTLIFSLCLVGAPVIITGMLATGLLPRNFAFVIAVLPLDARLISRLNLSDGGNLGLREVFMETSSLSLLFVVIITLVKLVS